MIGIGNGGATLLISATRQAWTDRLALTLAARAAVALTLVFGVSAQAQSLRDSRSSDDALPADTAWNAHPSTSIIVVLTEPEALDLTGSLPAPASPSPALAPLLAPLAVSGSVPGRSMLGRQVAGGKSTAALAAQAPEDAGRKDLALKERATVGHAQSSVRDASPARRAGAPVRGAARQAAKEVLVELPSSLSSQAIDDMARRHRLTRLESLGIGLTGTTFHRWRIWDRRSVSDVIRALQAEGGVAQPNYLYRLQ